MKRRTFLKLAGMGSLSFAAGCDTDPRKTLHSLVTAPDDMVTGHAKWYASTCRECPAGCGILAKNREGRIVKLEGNPLHPVNKGKLCMRGQAALQGIYHPDRITTPLVKDNNGWRPISFTQAEALLRLKIAGAKRKGKNRIRMITEVVGESLEALFSEWMKKQESAPPLVFETYAYESQKAANENIWGFPGLPAYRMERADTLVAFGADFLETWLSPVEYARKFKTMHRYRDDRKGIFFSVTPFRSLTAANADNWLGCRPGTEVFVVMGLLRQALIKGRGKQLPPVIRKPIVAAAEPFSTERVIGHADIPSEDFKTLVQSLLQAKKPLVLGTGNGGSGAHALETNMAVNLLNQVLDPNLSLIDFNATYRIETAAARSEVVDFFHAIEKEPADLLMLNNVNPAFSLPRGSGVKKALKQKNLYVVAFSSFMDETAEMTDLIFPVGLPLEIWDLYSGRNDVSGTLQPAMGKLTDTPNIGDVFLKSLRGTKDADADYAAYIQQYLAATGRAGTPEKWLGMVRRGGRFDGGKAGNANRMTVPDPKVITNTFKPLAPPKNTGLAITVTPSIRFFDGRGANRPWLCEVPDPVTKVAWQTPVIVHPETAASMGWSQKRLIEIRSGNARIKAPVYVSSGVRPGLLAMGMGQGHTAMGRYARNRGANPIALMSAGTEAGSGAPIWTQSDLSAAAIGGMVALANTDGSRRQHGRKIALSTTVEDLAHGDDHAAHGLTMDTFPLTLPIEEGYDPERDFYPPHAHDTYRWAMAIDLDRCIGCGACAAACYAENNLGVVGEERIIEGRELSWMRVERYRDDNTPGRMIFFPMLCQHCDNAPCESVCPVYAPHHSSEGLNNQIYNRCIGTRFCSQNCPYKVRRFNWYDVKWPKPLNLQLNPDVTVRSKGIMEKCSFCIQRIKTAHGIAKNEGREMLDGDVQPACLQTCPTEAIVFGNLMDKNSRIRRLTEDKRVYQAMGYLNTKPAVFYLKKVIHDI